MTLANPLGIILWDIDGTLIKIDDHRLNKHDLAINIILGKTVESLKNHSGMTDRQILKLLLGDSVDQLSKDTMDHIFYRLNELTKDELQTYPVSLNSFVEETLQKSIQLGWINGILTGNSFERALSKLRSAQLESYFENELIFHGQNFENRIDLVEFSKQKLIEKGFCKIVLVGDTPSDIISAKSSNLPVIATATGKFTSEQLSAYGPDLLISNFKYCKSHFYKFLSEVT